MYWGVSTRRARLWGRQPRRREGLWKRRGVEKSERRLSHPAWKSRKVRGIPTFPQPRRRLVNLLNRTYHVLQKPDILTCYGHPKRARRQLPVEKRRRSPYGTHIYPRGAPPSELERAACGVVPPCSCGCGKASRNML